MITRDMPLLLLLLLSAQLLGRVCGASMPLLVLCAIEGTQHSNQHSGVHAAAWVLPMRAAMAMCTRGGRKHFAWQPGQRAGAGRVADAPLYCRDKITFLLDVNQMIWVYVPGYSCATLCHRLTRLEASLRSVSLPSAAI